MEGCCTKCATGDCCKCEHACEHCLDCDLDNPCMIKETSNSELVDVLKEFRTKCEYEDKWFGKKDYFLNKLLLQYYFKIK